MVTFAKTIPNLSMLRVRLQWSLNIRLRHLYLHSPFLRERGYSNLHKISLSFEKHQNLGSIWGFRGRSQTLWMRHFYRLLCCQPTCRSRSELHEASPSWHLSYLLLLLEQKLCPPPPLRGEVMFAPKTYIKPELIQSTYVWLAIWKSRTLNVGKIALSDLFHGALSNTSFSCHSAICARRQWPSV